MLMGKATTSLHTSVNPFSLWFHRLEQMKLHLETECSPCASSKATARYLHSGTTYLAVTFSIKFKPFPAAEFSFCDVEQLCTDLLTKLFKYNKLLTVFSCTYL